MRANERAAFAVSVTGLAFANGCSQLGMLETGTNTELANTSGNRITLATPRLSASSLK
jgi:hypothetical protein